MSGGFDRVLAALEGIGVEPTAREAAEALWLATHIAGSASTTAQETVRAQSAGKDASARDRKRREARSANPGKPATLHAPTVAAATAESGTVTTRAIAVRVADVPALPHGLELMRALRPLKRKVPSRHRVILDETATAERSAEERLFLPATRPEPERWLSLALVVETGPTMTVWHPLVNELTVLLQRTGAFRDIRLWHLHSTPDGASGLHPRAIPTSALHSLREILDPTGRQAVWCVSDCVSALWHDGRADRLLETWGQDGPLAIIQPLPQRLWRRTGLRPEPVRLQTASPAAPNSRLRTTSSDSSALLRKPAAGIPVPVLELDRSWLSGWTRLVTATAPGGVPAVITTTDTLDGAATASGDDTISPTPAPTDPLSLVRAFRAHASAQAYRLAGCLASLPLTLPVMRLVQRVMLPASGSAHLAEVLLSGLVHHIPSDSANPVYDFAEGVREVLLSTLRRSDSRRVYDEVSAYLAAHAGDARDTQALAVLPSGQGEVALTMPSRPFAEITMRGDSRTSYPEPLAEPHTSREDLPSTSAGPESPPAPNERRPERVRHGLIADMVDALQLSAVVTEPGVRDIWCDMLANELGRRVEPYGGKHLRGWLLEVVRTCTQVPGDLWCLPRALDYIEPSSQASTALGPLVEEWEAVEFFNGVDLRPLRPALTTVGAPQSEALARRVSRQRFQELPRWCTTGWETFLHLAQMNHAEGEPPPTMAFLDLAAEQLTEHGQLEDAETLRRWSRTQARAMNLTQVLAQWHPPTAPVRSEAAVLTIQFEPDRVDENRYYLSHWRRSEGPHSVPGETVHVYRDELPGAVGQVVEETEERWADLRQPVVLEFMLPHALMNEPVEWWLKEPDSAYPTPLVMDYPVVLRSLERLRRASWHRPWRNRWRQLTDDYQNSRAYWSRPGANDISPFHLERELKEDSSVVCLILSQPPSDPSGRGGRELLAGLRAGVPAMIWHRHDCTNPAFREAVGEIVQDGNLGSLVDRITRLRREALMVGPEEWEGHIGRHLAVLFDDPDHMVGPPGLPQV
ncbi:SAV_2336 N-terminal domain-related protein [Streptomyces sp. R35]|uniref:SAV_2336 N-terminal domain-related protein n=1 Tax=Streptomyces sp. R35 TaxID=3238630 RepID=A0AB39SGF1_9ACTN